MSMSEGIADRVTVALASSDALGESPVWDEQSSQLLRVDITQHTMHSWSPTTGSHAVQQFEGDVGAVVLREGGGVIAAVEQELIVLSLIHI